VFSITRILIAEDEEILRSLLVKYFTREGFSIVEVDNGEDALNKALDEDFDIIILDILMPRKDGLTVLQELRLKKDTPVVILSVKGGWTEKREAIQMGATDYVLKPFSPAEFVKTVKEIVNTSN
jgi:DNA-binding response OmpR family regulator